MPQVAIIGGGAAGCFCAIELARVSPGTGITVYEANDRTLAKLAITGGGRCNLTNTFEDISDLRQAYPRGASLMKRQFALFSNEDCISWFENEGVRLVAQEDRCIFPASQDAMEVVRVLRSDMRRLSVNVRTRCRVTRISDEGDGGFLLGFGDGSSASADAVVVCTGGGSGKAAYAMFEGLGLEIVPPVPSLYSFHIGDPSLTSLAGIVAENVSVRLSGTPYKASGPLLITHEGVSGPAILKLSSYGARYLSDNGFRAELAIDWTGGAAEEDVLALLGRTGKANADKLVSSVCPLPIGARLWKHLLAKSGTSPEMRWKDASRKWLNRSAAALTQDTYLTAGRSVHKEEFVTCGGVALSNISPTSLGSKEHPGLFFAGEILDIDAITGGFNLQAAWTTGYRAARSVGEYLGDSSLRSE